jgi:predicted nucleic acid-binding protein
MIYVDSCIAMYLVGAAHENKYKVLNLLPQLLRKEDLVTSAEAFQEIIHRYLCLQDRETLELAYSALEDIVNTVFEVRKSDLDHGKYIALNNKKLSSRDCAHLGIMARIKCSQIWTFDKGYKNYPRISVIN